MGWLVSFWFPLDSISEVGPGRRLRRKPSQGQREDLLGQAVEMPCCPPSVRGGRPGPSPLPPVQELKKCLNPMLKVAKRPPHHCNQSGTYQTLGGSLHTASKADACFQLGRWARLRLKNFQVPLPAQVSLCSLWLPESRSNIDFDTHSKLLATTLENNP